MRFRSEMLDSDDSHVGAGQVGITVLFVGLTTRRWSESHSPPTARER
jgi:hypothetical protein